MALQARSIPEYGDKYLLREDGELYRRDARTDEWVAVSPSGEPPRVRLYANGTERRVYVHSLLEDVFWDRPKIAENYTPSPSPRGVDPSPSEACEEE